MPDPVLVDIQNLLTRFGDGLSLAEIRTTLGLDARDIRPALEAGLRDKLLRRTGSHNTLRYLANRAPLARAS